MVTELSNVAWQLLYCVCPGKFWAVCTSSPVDAETVFRSEGKYPTRGAFEDNLAWVYKKMNTPTTMSFR